MRDFEELYNAYFNDVYKYILRLSRNEHIAEEITAETFFKALRAVDTFRGECDVRVWLCQIAKNCYYTYEKKSRRTQSTEEISVESLSDPTANVADELIKKDEVRRVQEVLHEVGEPYKEVFMWRVYAELSFRQIGQIFGKTENWACVTYHRARKMIKERMGERYDEK